MKNVLKISLFIVVFTLSSCYTTFSKVDLYPDDASADTYLDDVGTWSSILSFAGGFFSSSFLFDDFFTRILFSSIDYVPYGATACYHSYDYYNPYGYGYAYTYISYNYWYYPPYHHYWKSPHYYPVKKDIRYAARSFKKRSYVPGGGKIKRSRPAQVDTRSNTRENDKENSAFIASNRVKRVRTTKYTRTNNSSQTRRVTTPSVKTRNRSATSATRKTSQPKNRTKDQSNSSSKKSDSSSKRDDHSKTRTRRR